MPLRAKIEGLTGWFPTTLPDHLESRHKKLFSPSKKKGISALQKILLNSKCLNVSEPSPMFATDNV